MTRHSSRMFYAALISAALLVSWGGDATDAGNMVMVFAPPPFDGSPGCWWRVLATESPVEQPDGEGKLES